MYDIIRIDDDLITDEHEGSGTRAKFWLKYPNGERWMFKYPRVNTEEHWSEKIAYEIAKFLGIECAVVELAAYHDDKGIVTKSFISDGESLVWGNQLLREMLGMQHDKKKNYKQRYHSVDNVLSALGKKRVKKQFIQYLLLDAIIGNTDRHDMNWGFVSGKDKKHFKLSPTYDHAASLGQEMTDARREEILSSKAGIAKYANHKQVRGVIYLAETETNAAPLVVLVEAFCARCGVKSINGIIPKKRLEALAGDGISKIIREMPDDWMSDAARRFAEALVRYNITEKVFSVINSHNSD